MFKNYLTIAIRNILRQKGYSFINIFGLAIGLASVILIFLWVKFEFSYDKPHQNLDHLYRLGQTQYYTSGPLHVFAMPGPIAADIKAEYPEIVNACRYSYSGMIIRHGDKKFSEEIIYGGKEIFSMFTFNFIKGDTSTMFKDHHSVVISEKMAKKYFDNDNPIGKVLIFNDKKNFKVTGVYEDMPMNSSLKFDFCIPFEHIVEDRNSQVNQYGWNSFAVYLQLAEGTDIEMMNEKIKPFMKNKRNIPELKVDMWLWPLKKIHLYKYTGGGMINTIYLFIIIAAFILLIACINFMNLSTARSTIRAKEIGLRKVMGARRKQIINQFVGESVLLSFCALVVALLIVSFILPSFNLITEKELVLDFSDPVIVLGLLILTLFTGFIAGSYPALYLSSFKPIMVLKGFVSRGKFGANFRRILVVFQFTLSVMLIIGTIIIYKQLNYVMDKDIGLRKDNVIYTGLQRGMSKKFDVIKSLLIQNPGIQHVSYTNHLPFMVGSNTSSIRWPGKLKDQDFLIGFTHVGKDFAKTMGITIKEGRFFEKGYGTDSISVVLNENAVKVMGLKNPVGQYLNWGDNHRFKIIGVVKDYNFKHMSEEISPLSIYNAGRGNYMLIKLNKTDIQQSLDYIEECWDKVYPTVPFSYTFLDDRYREIYQREEKSGELFKYFAILAILISSLGLFGLTSYLAEQKTKEIGIRKVLGSSVSGILLIMSKEFIRWIIVANMIAWPVTWYLGRQFLDTYAYRTNIGIWIFIIAAVISFIIAFLTISYQAFKAANSNPVNALRYE